MAKTLTQEILKREQEVREQIEEYSELFDLDPNLVRALITQESKFDHDAKSPTGAYGYGQFTMIAAKQVQQIAKMCSFAKDLDDFTKDQADEPDRGIKAICATLWWLFYVKYKGVADKKTQIEAVLTFYNAGGRAAALVVKKNGHSNAVSELKALPAGQRSQSVIYSPETLEWFVEWYDLFREKPKVEKPAAAKPTTPFDDIVAKAPGTYAPLVEALILLGKLDHEVSVVKTNNGPMTEVRIVFNGKY